jgi:hypothetical protein
MIKIDFYIITLTYILTLTLTYILTLTLTYINDRI